jgi:hypothetical protein
MKQNLTSIKTFDGYLSRLNPLKVLSLIMALAFILGGSTTLKATPFNLSSLPGYGVATSATFNFNAAGGWAGWSVPAGKVVLGAKIISAGDNFSDFAVFRPASPGQVFPHYTYGANEYGWVMQARSGQSNPGVQIEVYYADPLVGYVITQSNQLNYNGAGGYGGWSAPAGDIVSGGGYQFNNAYSSASVSALGEPNSVWPHGTFGPNDQGWVLRGPFNDLPNPGRIYVISFDAITVADCGTNKIANGDFELGNTGFYTSYTYTADLAGNSELVPENRYSVGANANNYHPQLIGTGRTGNFLIVNGNTTTVKELWAQDVTVTSGREYTFKMYTQNLYTLNAPKFSFKITPNDGVSGSVEFGTSNPLAGRNGWIEVSATYTSTFTGSAKLSIIDTDLTKIGNDFGIDDISFIETCPVGCSPVEVISFNQGTQSDLLTPVLADRSNTSEALGTPENSDVATSAANYNFVTLGIGGEIVLKFAYPIKNGAGDDIYVVETSFGNPTCARYPEKIRAFASQDNCNWVYLGEGCQNTYFDLQGLNWAQYVKLVDITNPASFSGVVDGYDLDGVICLHGEELNPVPTNLVGGSAQTVVTYAPGLCKNGNAVPTARRNPTSALGAPQNNNTINFVALGFGGSLVVKFDYVIFNNPAATDLRVVETSYGNPSCAAYPERAMVEGSLFENGPWTSFGELCQDGEVEIGTAGAIQYIRLTDRSAATSFGGSADAYDVDAIVVINPACGTLAARTAAEQIVDVVNVPNEEVSSSLFPNPASDVSVLSIEGTNANETWTVSITDISGRVISTTTFVSNEGISEHRISVSDLSSGIYQIVATNGSNKIVQKLVH